MKRILLAGILVLLVMGMWMSHINSQKAQANSELLALLAFGQTAPAIWRPPIPMPQVVSTLVDGQLTLCYQLRSVLIANIAHIQSKPAGYYVSVSDSDAPNGRSTVPKDEWLAEANVPLLALDAHITLLESQ